jgi:hypothetical protein
MKMYNEIIINWTDEWADPVKVEVEVERFWNGSNPKMKYNLPLLESLSRVNVINFFLCHQNPGQIS